MSGGKNAAQALRAVLLVAMVASLPMTSGWITVYVLGGIVLVFGLGCLLCNCCIGDCVGECVGGCCGSVGCCGGCCLDGCGGCACEGCDCGDCGDCGCAETMPPEVAPAAAALPLVVPMTRRLPLRSADPTLPAHWLSHHPDTAEYDQDTYPVAGLRLCIGCFTTYPLFLLASAGFVLAAPGGAWWAWLVGGVALAALQGVSSAGLARLRWQKAFVKSALGVGLAFAVQGVLSAPWETLGKQAALLGLVALAGLSAVPRAVRMRRGQA